MGLSDPWMRNHGPGGPVVVFLRATGYERPRHRPSAPDPAGRLGESSSAFKGPDGFEYCLLSSIFDAARKPAEAAG
jgi:hypothetical protein